MKNASIVLSSLALIGVIVLFVMQAGNKNGAPGTVANSNSGATSGRIAYVDIDSLNANYEYLRDNQAKFKKEQEAMEAELERSEQQLNSEAAGFRQKAQAGQLSQAEGEAAQKRLMQVQQSLDTRKQALTEQFLKKTDEFNEKIQKQLDSFLTEYNKTKGYDYILSYKKGVQIMHANKSLDITKDVIKGMNELSKKMGDTANEK